MDSDELRALLAVAKTGSYHAAARSLGFSRSTLRRRIGELEARVGRPLVKPTQNGVELTATGVKIAHRGQGILADIQAMFAHLRMDGDEPTGEIRLGAPTGIPSPLFQPLLTVLRNRFPRVRVRLRFFDDLTQIPEHELDSFIDYSALPVTPGWSVFDLCRADEVLLASPGYLKRRGIPTSIDDLAGHELLTWAPPDRDPTRWPHADGTHFTVEPKLICANGEVVHYLAASGAGIALIPHAELQLPGLGIPPNALAPVLPDLVRGARTVRVRISDDVLELPSFRSLLDITKRYVGQLLGGTDQSPKKLS